MDPVKPVDNLCVPMKVEAFRLNPSAASPLPDARLAPISQPDYTRLRLDQHLRADILGEIDIRDTGAGPELNNRVTNVATGEPRTARFGMYLHWVIPRFYRSGVSATESSAKDLPDIRDKQGHGGPDLDNTKIDPQSPTYRPLPSRWLVIRHLKTKQPPNANIPTYQAFVIESDRLKKVGDLGADVDIEVDVSPFVYMEDETKTLAEQAEMYIGHKAPAETWEESPESITRVELSVLGNVNHLFVDYQPHNSNVFSMLDNFAYEDGGVKYLEAATADYYVMGWHSNPEHDPLSPSQQSKQPSHSERLDACYMQMPNKDAVDIKKWLDAPLDTRRTVIHGALYEVEWNVHEKPSVVPADTYNREMNELSPVSVGTNPIDALLAVVHAQSLSNDVERQAEDPSAKPDPLAQDILSLQTLVIKKEEDPDTQLAASDALYSTYFLPADGGKSWHVAGSATSTSDKKPTVPGPDERKDLAEANNLQNLQDLCSREAAWLEWQVWAEWWKWVSSPESTHTEDAKLEVRKKVNDFRDRHRVLFDEISSAKNDIQALAAKYNWELAALPRYYTSKDPTAMLCGIKSGWPLDWTDLLKVRLDSQAIKVNDTFTSLPDGWNEFNSFLSPIAAKLPPSLQPTAQILMAEFFALQRWAQSTPNLRLPPLKDLVFPLYHDSTEPLAPDQTTQPMRDTWNNTQPWFPLFIEWEIEYYHIPHDLWVLGSRGPYGPPKVVAEIKPSADIRNLDDKRTVGGRALVLPHANTMLKDTVEKLLKNEAKSDSLAAMNAAIDKLDLLTLKLTSVSGQLATKHQYTHLKPTKHIPGQDPSPLQEALDASRDAIDEEAFSLMFNASMTPYGDHTDYSNSKYSPFKPAIHGQFMFTKLNVVDKFGQVVSADNHLHPYISEFYACSTDKSSETPTPLTVDEDRGRCVQLEPRINQECRLNGHYVLWDNDTKYWRPVTEYENPIWGWLVVNYVDNGLQLFLPDGTFFREIRLGGPDGTSAGIRAWLPFAPPGPDEQAAVPAQLRALVTKICSDHTGTYLQEFFDVMSRALDATMHTPNQYAGYLPAITGKPFALVNSGWSLELSHPPDVDHATSVSPDAIPEPPLEEYNFQVKLGDRDRTFDGLLGFFAEKSPMDFDLDRFYTYWPGPDPSKSQTIEIGEDNYPTLQPFYHTPLDGTGLHMKIKDPLALHNDYNKNLKVFGMLVDPFTMIHGYTGFLPVTTLQLPQWALEQSLKNITAFFHLGPIIIPNNPPPYDASRILKSGSDLKKIPDPPKDSPPYLIPSIAIADWAWLQPFNTIPPTVDNIAFNPFKLGPLSDEPKFEPAPYTAVEGYLQLKTPITGSDKDLGGDH